MIFLSAHDAILQSQLNVDMAGTQKHPKSYRRQIRASLNSDVQDVLEYMKGLGKKASLKERGKIITGTCTVVQEKLNKAKVNTRTLT